MRAKRIFIFIQLEQRCVHTHTHTCDELYNAIDRVDVPMGGTEDAEKKGYMVRIGRRKALFFIPSYTIAPFGIDGKTRRTLYYTVVARVPGKIAFFSHTSGRAYRCQS